MALGYLLGAAIQFEDKNGKPLVGGTIRVCLHGTSTPYLTYRDFNGNRNPEFVPLNAAGMCVLIADDAGVYDVYCKDQFGVEQWSRLNVTVGGAGGGGGGSYVAGDGILIANDTISVDPSVVQEKLTAGDNISINNNVISATDHDTTYTATAPIAIDSSNDISISLGNGLTTESGSLVIDTGVVRSVPDSDGTNEGQVLGVTNSSGDIGWVTVTPAGTVDQTYDPTSSNAQSGTAVAEAIAGVNEVPTATSGDNGKVLGVTDSQGNIGWVTDQDTTYSAGTGLTLTGTTFSADTSVLATQNDLNGKQDSLTAGSNITISNNVISATDTTYTFSTGLTESSGTVTVDNPLPTASGSDNGKVLGVTDAQGTIGWVTPTAAQVQSDWTEADTADPSYIQNKPAEKALAAGANISISEGTNDITISATNTTYSAGDGIGISSNVISRKVQFVTPSSTYSAIRHVLDEGDIPVLDVANGSYHNYFFPTHKSGTHVDFVGSMGYTTYPTYEAANYMLKYSVDNNDSWTVTKYQELPDYTSSDASKALVVNSGGTGVEWSNPTATLFEAVYGQTTYAEVNAAVTAKKIVYCCVSATGASRMAFLAYKGSSTYEFQYYRSVSSHTDSQQGDEVYVYTVSSSGSTASQQWSTTTRQAYSKVIAGTGLSSSFTTGVSSSITLNVDTPVPAYNSTYAGDLLAVNSAGNGLEWIDNQVPAYTSSDQYKVLSVAYNGNGTQWRDVREVPSFAVVNQGYLLGVVNNGGTVELGWTQPMGYWTQAVDIGGSHTLTAEDIAAGYVDFEATITASNTSSVITSPTYAALSWDVQVDSDTTSNVVSSVDFALGISGSSYDTIFSDNNPAHEVHKDWGITRSWMLNYRKNRVRARCNLASGASVGKILYMNCGGIVTQVR